MSQTVHNKKTVAAAYRMGRGTLNTIIKGIPDFGPYRYKRFTDRQLELLKQTIGDFEPTAPASMAA